MKHIHRTDFWFAGVAILPVVFLCAGRPEAILMLYLPLLIVACLFGIYEQKMDPTDQNSLCERETPAQPPTGTSPSSDASTGFDHKTAGA